MANPKKSSNNTGSRKASLLYIAKLQNGPRAYLITSVAILVLSLVMALLAIARIQLRNAEYFLHSGLFNDKGAYSEPLPLSFHRIITKFSVPHLNISAHTYILLSIIVVITSFCIFMRILFIIERRPLQIGTVYLILSSLLIIIAGASYSSLISINLPLLAIRSSEYTLFLLALMLALRGANDKTNKRALVLSLVLLTLLFVSNARFMIVSLAGALIMGVIYAFARSKRIAKFAAQWFTLSVLATSLALAIRWWTSALHFYANAPTISFNEGIYGKITHSSPLAPFALIWIIALILFAITMTVLFVKASLTTKPVVSKSLPSSPLLAIMLVSSSIVSLLVLAALKSNKISGLMYCAGLGMVALIVAATTFNKASLIDAKKIIAVCIVISATMTGFVTMNASALDAHSNNQSQAFRTRNQNIASALKNRHVNYLLGDYWRTAPVAMKLNSNKPSLVSVDNCVSYKASDGKGADLLETGSFAYVLTLDKNESPESGCTLEKVEKAFGQPNTTIVISGTIKNPNELLLFYDKGNNRSGPTTKLATPLSPLISELNNSSECLGKTIMAVVAHQDDDLLFMNPDVSSIVTRGFCIRTVYLTAGDNGSNNYYWLQRRQGTEAAYNTMLGKPGQLWTEKTVQLPNNQYISVASPTDNPKISLLFTNIPDGNLNGEGFGNHGFQSLHNLWTGRIPQIQTVDGVSTLNTSDLTTNLTLLMQTYQPLEIWTQSYKSAVISDHSDHRTTGLFTQKAYEDYVKQLDPQAPKVPLTFYIGYPIRGLPQNLSDEELQAKYRVFLSYSEHDMTICSPLKPCDHIGTYQDYISRQYKEDPSL